MEALNLVERCATEAPSAEAILDLADARRIEHELPYAGAVTPLEAWNLLSQRQARLVDVRTAPEVKFVGNIPEATHIEWRGADLLPSAMFVNALRAVARPSETVLLICRSGVRSHQAARAAALAGFRKVYNVLEGFEGQRNHAGRRGEIDGWRKSGLPWVQD